MNFKNTLNAAVFAAASVLADGCAHTEKAQVNQPKEVSMLSDACLASREQLKSLVKTDSCEGMYLTGAQVGIHLEKCDDPTTLFGGFITREFAKKERLCQK